MKFKLSASSLRKTAIIVSFLPPVLTILYAAYLIAVDLTGLYHVFQHFIWYGISMFGIVASVLGIIYAWIALRHPLAGGILIILSGCTFFAGAAVTNHYTQMYLPASAIYAVGGFLHVMRLWYRQNV